MRRRAVALVLLAVAACSAVAQTTVLTSGSGACTTAMRDTINPATGFPYCVKVALLRAGASSNPYYTNDLPKRVFDNAILDADPNTTVYVEESNLIWEQGITAVANGTYDVFVANIWVLRRRVRLVDFSSPFLLESLGLLYLKKEEAERDFLSIFSPLQWTLWLGVLCTMVIAGLVLMLSELAHPSSATGDNPLADRNDIALTARRCLFHALNVPFGTMEHVPTPSPGKLISWVNAFFFLIVIATYTANLASSLTVVSASGTVTTETLLASPVLAGPGDSGPFIEALGGSVISVGFGDLNGDGLRRNPEGKSLVLSGNALTSVTNVDCGTGQLKLDIPIDSALVFRQRESITVFKRKLDEAILRMKEVGVLDRWAKAGLPAKQCSEAGELTSTAMSFDNLAGVFLITGVIMGVLLIFALIRFAVQMARSPTDEAGEEKKGSDEKYADRGKDLVDVEPASTA